MGTSIKGFVGKVKYHVGLVFWGDKQESFEQQVDAWKKEADCGCGIDCCDKELVLTDKTTGEFMALYFDDGAMFVRNRTTGIVSEIALTPIES